MSVTGIVLAGGRAARFGGPKLAAELDGAAILARAVAAVAEVAGEILVAGPALPERAGEPGNPRTVTRLIVDSEPFAGPLAALAGALGQAQGGIAVVVAGDMPRLVPEVLRAMVARLTTDDKIDAVILGAPNNGVLPDAVPGGRRQVLPLAIRVGTASIAARDALAAGDRSLRGLLGRLACDEIPPDQWLPLDPAAATLLDVDTPSDLERLRGSARDGDVP